MKILKPGETGYGYLVEYDAGFITPELTCADGTCSNANLIREFDSSIKSPDLYQGTEDIPQKVTLYAVLQKHGIENRNGRIYPKEVLIKQNEVYQEYIKMKTALGELNHPESSIIDGERVSHLITETWWDGATLMGKLELDTTPGYHTMGIVSTLGDKVANMLRKGWTVGISSRGVGSLKQEGGKNIVQDDFEIICWDIVTSPSTPGAWISTEESDLKTFTESTTINTNKNIVSESDRRLLDKLNKLL
jgi:hypothetical protein